MRWLAVLLWIVVIFLLSTEHFSARHTPVASDMLRFLIRKAAHWSEYFILAFLLMRALSANSDETEAKRQVVLSVLVAVVYAVTDEWHQSFVPSREAKLTDVGIDALGACCGTWSWSRVRTHPWMRFIIPPEWHRSESLPRG